MTDPLTMTAPQVEALPEAGASEVLAAWVKARRADLPAALARSASKAHARLAKKALYQLQSQGVAVEAPRATEAAPGLAPTPARNTFEGVLSEQHGTGERLYFFAVPVRGGGLELFQGVINDEFGVVQFGSLVSNRNAYRKRLDELRADPSSGVMLVPFERIQLELGRAMTLNQRTRTDYGEDFEQALARIGVTPQDPDVPVPPPDAAGAASPGDTEALCALREIAQWLPSEALLEALGQRVNALRALVVPGEVLEAQEKAHAQALAAEHFTPAVRQLYARRLWYMGEFFETVGRATEGALARAEARRLFHGEGPGRFGELLFERALPTLQRARPGLAGALPLPRPRG